MTRLIFAAGLASLFALPSASQKTSVDFSAFLSTINGRWIANIEQTKASGSTISFPRTGPPPAVTIGHDDRSVYFVRQRRAGEARRTYALDGGVNRNTIPLGADSEEEVSTAAWKDAAFVITVVGPDNKTTEIIRWYLKDQWLIEEDTHMRPTDPSHPTSSLFYERDVK